MVKGRICDAILDTDKHVIIASGTASGKTEAAFFPILTLLDNNPSDSIGIMYIGPLKALINDQFERLNDLLDDIDIPVWSWRGDISQSHKKKALKTAKGVLQITPESLEALIMRHPGDASRLFSDLRFIVIDDLTKKLQKLVIDKDNPNMVLNDNQAPRIDKYDYMVPDELLREAYLYNQVNVPSVNKILNNLHWM